MAYGLKEGSSLEVIRAYIVRVIAALLAIPKLAGLAEPWRKKKAEVATLRDQRDEARDLELETSARVRVLDAEWDGSVVGLASQAHLLAGKDANRPPYSDLFGTVKAAELKRLGPAKAALAGEALVKKGMQLEVPALQAQLEDLRLKTEALRQAEAEDAEAELALRGHEVRKLKLVRALNTLIAETQLGILTAFPGRDELVRAVLNPDTGKKSRASDEDEAPADPE